MNRRKRKPPKLYLTTRSDVILRRVACVLAWEELDWPAKNRLEARARHLIESLAAVRP